MSNFTLDYEYQCKHMVPSIWYECTYVVEYETYKYFSTVVKQSVYKKDGRNTLNKERIRSKLRKKMIKRPKKVNRGDENSSMENWSEEGGCGNNAQETRRSTVMRY